VESLTGEIVFARVNPEHKLRIVEAFQRCGKTVAVTGDGVNDAPALKKADIGVAMGIAGSDVAKESADMILLDDNFASIVKAIEEGRAVYDNIKKFAVYVFNSNMAEAVPFVVMLLSGGVVAMPLTIMQILSIDLGTDMLPALGLGADPAERGIMQRTPRSLSKSLLSPALLTKALLWYGAIEAVAGMSGYFFLNWLHGWPQVPLAAIDTPVWRAATTMTLACIVSSQVAAVFCCRTQSDSLFSINPFENRLILLGVLVETILLACLIYLPFLQDIFSTAPLGRIELTFVLIWIPIMVTLDEARKFFVRKREKSRLIAASQQDISNGKESN
jgi:Ca2+-transporting ATPase